MTGVCCVVFDVDDTLYLERDYVSSGFREVGEWARINLGIPDFFERAYEAFEAGSRNTIFDQILNDRGIDDRDFLVKTLVDIYRKHDPKIELLRDALGCIERIRGRFALAVITDGPLISQRAKCKALDLARWMNPILFTEELGANKGKPHPLSFRRIEQAIGCRGSRCVYIADNPAKDFQGPKSLGWKTIRVRRKGGMHFAFPTGSDVDIECEDLSAVMRIHRTSVCFKTGSP